jgi:hypothetical protein
MYIDFAASLILGGALIYSARILREEIRLGVNKLADRIAEVADEVSRQTDLFEKEDEDDVPDEVDEG